MLFHKIGPKIGLSILIASMYELYTNYVTLNAFALIVPVC